MATASHVDSVAQQTIITGLSGEFAAAAGSRIRSFDILHHASTAMWTVALTMPTVNAGLGFRTAFESGSGRTRAETNKPEATSAG